MTQEYIGSDGKNYRKLEVGRKTWWSVFTDNAWYVISGEPIVKVLKPVNAK